MSGRWPTAGLAAALAAVTLSSALGPGCTTPIRSTLPGPPPPAQMAELWVEPADGTARDLYWGPGGPEHAPKAAGRWEFVSRDNTGFSPGFKARDENGMVWSIKVGAEAQSEVVASRLMWALGFHQPPTYYVGHWTMSGTAWTGPQEPARFRPELSELKSLGVWSWHSDPFVGTPPWRGALVMMAMLNNSDLKPAQNVIYGLPQPREGASRWYVVKDLGQAFGATGRNYPKRNDIKSFERQGFIEGVENGRVRFDYSGRWRELFRDLSPADVRWTCGRLARLTDKQWEDAFRAAEYTPELAQQFIKRMREKIAQGMSLPQ